MHLFNSAAPPPARQTTPAWWFALQERRLLVHMDGQTTAAIPHLLTIEELGVTPVRAQYLGQFRGRDCYATEVAQEIPPPVGMQFVGLRRLFGQLEDDLLRIAGRALQMVDWDRFNQFCGRCATPMNLGEDRAKVCPHCQHRVYPRISPAVIMAVTKENQLLLARSTRHPAGFHSVLAGFSEPGETLEETVAREVQEEVGLHVGNIRYFGSQPWPFPDSLMIGFTCDYAGGTLAPDPAEIAHAAWYTAETLRQGELLVPPAAISIAGQLIEWFIHRPPPFG